MRRVFYEDGPSSEKELTELRLARMTELGLDVGYQIPLCPLTYLDTAPDRRALAASFKQEEGIASD